MEFDCGLAIIQEGGVDAKAPMEHPTLFRDANV